MPEEEKPVGKLVRVKIFFRQNSKKLFFTGIVVMVLSVLALTPGVGYTMTIDITSSHPLVEGHPCVGYICEGTLRCDFNSLLYPLNHLFECEFSKTFIGRSDPYDSLGESVRDSARMRTLLSEFPINILFYFLIGSAIAIGLDKFIKTSRRRRHHP